MPEHKEYPEIIDLLTAIRKHGLQFKAQPQTSEEKQISYRRLILHYGGQQMVVPVDDEYEDLRSAESNTALMLHLILRACKDYEEAEDFLVWCKEAGLPASQAGLREMYFELRESVPKILEIINDEAQPLSHWDFSMNTGIARVLRAQTHQ